MTNWWHKHDARSTMHPGPWGENTDSIIWTLTVALRAGLHGLKGASKKICRRWRDICGSTGSCRRTLPLSTDKLGVATKTMKFCMLQLFLIFSSAACFNFFFFFERCMLQLHGGNSAGSGATKLQPERLDIPLFHAPWKLHSKSYFQWILHEFFQMWSCELSP